MSHHKCKRCTTGLENYRDCFHATQRVEIIVTTHTTITYKYYDVLCKRLHISCIGKTAGKTKFHFCIEVNQKLDSL